MAKKRKGKKGAQRQGVDSRTQNVDISFWSNEGIGQVLRMFVAGGLGAAVLNLALWTLSLGLFNVNPQVIPPGAAGPEALQPLAVLMASAIPALVAAIVYYFLVKFRDDDAWRIFRIVAIVLVILSLIPVWSMPVGSGSKLVLSLMHIASAAGILWGMRYTLEHYIDISDLWVKA